MATKIEWAEETWNPISGCSKISEGCLNCYAERMSHRLSGRYGYPKSPNQFRTTFHRDKLTQPSVWKKPLRIFVCSMADIFHDDVRLEWFGAIFDQVKKNPQHTFMFLTKRPERMRYFFDEYAIFNYGVLPNVWLGVTAENQKMADERIPILLQIPAAVRFVSIEPMLGPVDLQHEWLYRDNETGCRNRDLSLHRKTHVCPECSPISPTGGINWVICGGESGPGARPMHPDWVRSIRDQCVESGTPFMFKQWGEWGPEWLHISGPKRYRWEDDKPGVLKVGKKNAGRTLDGKEWNQYPGEV